MSEGTERGAVRHGFLYCAICWLLEPRYESDAPGAVSIVGGYALCEQHLKDAPIDDSKFADLAVKARHRWSDW